MKIIHFKNILVDYGGIMEYRKATIKEAQLVCDIVQDTKAQIYPHYYTQAVVDFFGRLHSLDNIKKDIIDHSLNAKVLLTYVVNGIFFLTTIMKGKKKDIFQISLQLQKK